MPSNSLNRTLLWQAKNGALQKNWCGIGAEHTSLTQKTIENLKTENKSQKTAISMQKNELFKLKEERKKDAEYKTKIIERTKDIDEKLKYYACNQRNNDALLLNLDVKKDVIKKLIRYKQIITKRLYNPNYSCEIALGNIITQIKIYINK